jgi:very-short-patch-repair endonuclease
MKNVNQNQKNDRIQIRRELRRNATEAEILLWHELRNRKLNFKFRRQKNIGHYIIDFYCVELRLAIEVDGPIHEIQLEYDQARDEFLTACGITTLRLKNYEIIVDLKTTLEKIKMVCKELVDK